MYIDALVVKIKDGAHVRNKAAHLVIGVDVDGARHVLGIWVQSAEGAKFWMQVFTDLRNRGVTDVLIACCDGLEGLPQRDRDNSGPGPPPKPVSCTSFARRCGTWPTKTAAPSRRSSSRCTPRRTKTPRWPRSPSSPTPSWDASTRPRPGSGNAPGTGTPEFLAFPPEVRKIIYTTNAIEGLNRLIRKIIKNRGHFPNDDAAIKLIWLAIRDIEDKRARAREKEKNKPRNKRNAPGKLVEGAQVQGWKQALNALDAAYPGRLPEHLI